MRISAKVISYIFHPLLLTTYLVLLFSWAIPRFLLISPALILKFAGFVFVITFVFPVANLLMLKAFGTLSSLEMTSRRERLLPFTMITIFYAVIAVMFMIKVSGNVNFNKIMLIVSTLALIATVATLFLKVSIHSLGFGGAIGILLQLNRASMDNSLIWPTVLVIAIGGLVMSSRLYLNVHRPREILYGALLGFATGFAGVIFLF